MNIGRVLLISGALFFPAARAVNATLIEDLPLHNDDPTATVGTNGVLANDSAGSPPANNPTATTDQNGTPGGAIAFATANKSYVSVAGGGGLAGLDTGTIAFWVKWTGTQGSSMYGNATLVGRQQNGSYSNDLIGLTSTNPANATIKVDLNSFNDGDITGSTVVGDGAWHFVALTIDASTNTEKLYVDGNLDGSGSEIPNLNSGTAAALTLGAWIGDGANYTTSAMHDFQVYNTALTQSQVQALIPEPSSIAAIGLGSLGLLARRRRT